jgi:uncharacterized membrane protein YoaK (UPF0700 family)
MSVAVPPSRRWTVAALLVLTGVTGLVDTFTFLGLGHVFVANMTGNIIFLGLSLHPGAQVEAVTPAVAIAGFVIGAILGGAAARLLFDRPRRWLCTAFAIQAGMLATVAALVASDVLDLSGPWRPLTVGVLAFPPGLQAGTAHRLGMAGLTTTVLTMTLAGVTSDSIFGWHAAKPGRRLGSIAAMLCGAVAGAVLLTVSVTLVLTVAAILVALVTLALALALGPVKEPSTDRDERD